MRCAPSLSFPLYFSVCLWRGGDYHFFATKTEISRSTPIARRRLRQPIGRRKTCSSQSPSFPSPRTSFPFRDGVHALRGAVENLSLGLRQDPEKYRTQLRSQGYRLSAAQSLVGIVSLVISSENVKRRFTEFVIAQNGFHEYEIFLNSTHFC